MRLTVVLMTSSLLAAFLVMEGVLRLLPNPPIPLGIPDAELGYIYRPGFISHGVNAESGREVSVRINTAGFRDGEWDASVRPVIMVVGDSFTSAEGVSEEDRFTELLEAALHARGWDGSVLNLGIAGSGPEAYIERIRKYVPIFKPDWVVVAIFNGNDLENVNHDLTPSAGRKNYLVRDGGVSAYRDFAGLSERLVWRIKTMLGRSYLMQLVKDVKVKLSAHGAADATTEVGGSPLHYCELRPEDLENSFIILEKLLTDMAILADGRLLVLSIPDKEQLRDDLPSDCDPEFVEKRLYGITTGLTIPMTALYPRFKGVDEEFYFAGHLNERGHEVAADVLYESLYQE